MDYTPQIIESPISQPCAIQIKIFPLVAQIDRSYYLDCSLAYHHPAQTDKTDIHAWSAGSMEGFHGHV